MNSRLAFFPLDQIYPMWVPYESNRTCRPAGRLVSTFALCSLHNKRLAHAINKQTNARTYGHGEEEPPVHTRKSPTGTSHVRERTVGLVKPARPRIPKSNYGRLSFHRAARRRGGRIVRSSELAEFRMARKLDITRVIAILKYIIHPRGSQRRVILRTKLLMPDDMHRERTRARRISRTYTETRSSSVALPLLPRSPSAVFTSR